MPGVLIVEALAQVGAVAILSQPDFKEKLLILEQSIQRNSRKRLCRVMC